jgi:hypothetical protein
MAQFADFFDSDALRSVLLERAAQNAAAPQLASKRAARRPKSDRAIERKDSADK